MTSLTVTQCPTMGHRAHSIVLLGQVFSKKLRNNFIKRKDRANSDLDKCLNRSSPVQSDRFLSTSETLRELQKLSQSFLSYFTEIKAKILWLVSRIYRKWYIICYSEQRSDVDVVRIDYLIAALFFSKLEV